MDEPDAISPEANTVAEVPAQSPLDRKINEHFGGLVVRKDLVKAVKGNAIVPSYVLEYLLGQYAASDDEATIQAGIETVRAILADHYVHRNEAGLVRSTIRERGRYKVIDRVSVALNDKDDVYEAEFANLGINGVLVDSATIKAHPKLLVGGVWCICDVEYLHSEDQRVVPWIMGSIKPIQLSNFDAAAYLAARREFTTDEWIDLLIQSIGFNPEMFGRRAKLLQLIRLIPFVERNYNLVELGPKGTGKSHIFSEFSPHGMLISGGEVTVPKLFVNNANGRLGLVGYWDVVAFDEFAGKAKKTDKALVDIMKNYMANRTFSRGIETLGAEASMVFVGNTSHTVAYMLKHSDLFDELPASYHDSAFLDRLHHYIPGWEVDVIRGEMFSSGYGFVVDYIAEILKSMRNQDFSDRYSAHFTLSSDISTRDRDGIHKTFSGLMKILYPNEDATVDEIEEILRLSIEGRKRVKDQIVRIDKTMSAVDFSYATPDGTKHAVRALEEVEFPASYGGTETAQPATADAPKAQQPDDAPVPPPPLKDGFVEYLEGQKGVSYRELLIPYLAGASELQIADPYIRLPHQIRNLEDLLGLLAVTKAPEDEIQISLKTVVIPESQELAKRQLTLLASLQDAAAVVGIKLSVDFVAGAELHDRYIKANNGWRVVLGKGLDIFQRPADGAPFAQRMQEFRATNHFSVTYVSEKKVEVPGGCGRASGRSSSLSQGASNIARLPDGHS